MHAPTTPARILIAVKKVHSKRFVSGERGSRFCLLGDGWVGGGVLIKRGEGGFLWNCQNPNDGLTLTRWPARKYRIFDSKTK